MTTLLGTERKPLQVDENGFTADKYRRLELGSMKSMYVSNVIAMIIITAVLLAAAMYATLYDSRLKGEYRDLESVGK